METGTPVGIVSFVVLGIWILAVLTGVWVTVLILMEFAISKKFLMSPHL
jgi:hypothetical protein